ncbi:DUF6879 family protein [Kitasatospora aureofaciens]|uniref:DUF6879 family protein n=1 Tax=Kitasatospora aureofaciens TaxID=1894 RepID=UPI0037CC79C9
MSRRLRYLGSISPDNTCPTLHDDTETEDVVVQGDAVTDPDDITQFRDIKPGEGFVTAPRLVEHNPVLISLDEFDDLFTTFQYTAYRLETRRRYRSDEQSETYRQFIAGQPPEWDLETPWCRSRREQSALGKRFERVRIMDNPPTPGQRYLLNNSERNSRVGEDIRYLWRADAERLGLPEEDAWLFDSRFIALLHFDSDDDLIHVELITDPVRVARACQERDAAWHYAVPHGEFGAQVAPGS